MTFAVLPTLSLTLSPCFKFTSHLRFVLDDVKNNGIENQNNHWQPLHKMCPFCLLDFRCVELLMI